MCFVYLVEAPRRVPNSMISGGNKKKKKTKKKLYLDIALT